MKTLIVGAGATGGSLGAALVAAGRDVTFLARPASAARLRDQGLRLQGPEGDVRDLEVQVLTAAQLHDPYDLVIAAVRGGALGSALVDLRPAVGSGTQVVPLLNGMAHLAALAEAFGQQAVLGATARLAATLMPDGTVVEQIRGIALELGRPWLPHAHTDSALNDVYQELAVDGVSVTVSDDIVREMWDKWVFIAASAVITTLAGAVIGDTASVAGGPALAAAAVEETAAVAEAAGHPLGERRVALTRLLSEPTSRFAPSLTREYWAGRPAEVEVLDDLAARAREHHLPAPLLNAAAVRLRLGAGAGR